MLGCYSVYMLRAGKAATLLSAGALLSVLLLPLFSCEVYARLLWWAKSALLHEQIDKEIRPIPQVLHFEGKMRSR